MLPSFAYSTIRKPEPFIIDGKRNTFPVKAQWEYSNVGTVWNGAIMCSVGKVPEVYTS